MHVHAPVARRRCRPAGLGSADPLRSRGRNTTGQWLGSGVVAPGRGPLAFGGHVEAVDLLSRLRDGLGDGLPVEEPEQGKPSFSSPAGEVQRCALSVGTCSGTHAPSLDPASRSRRDRWSHQRRHGTRPRGGLAHRSGEVSPPRAPDVSPMCCYPTPPMPTMPRDIAHSSQGQGQGQGQGWGGRGAEVAPGSSTLVLSCFGERSSVPRIGVVLG